MEVIKNRKLIERRNFLERAMNNNNIDPQDYYIEIKDIEEKISENLIEALQQCKENMVTEIETAKKEIKSDGDFKRTIANALINILSSQLENAEIKGIFRQGYKIMRGK